MPVHNSHRTVDIRDVNNGDQNDISFSTMQITQSIIRIAFVLFFSAFFCSGACRKHAENSPPVRQPVPPVDSSATDVSLDTIKAKIHYRETLSAILRKHGIDHSINYRLCQEFGRIFNLRRLKPGQPYRILRDSSDSYIRFTLQPSVEEQYTVVYNNDSLFTTVKRIELIKKVRKLHGIVETTMYDAILQAGETPELLIAFTDIFQWDVDFFIDPRIGDAFKIIFEAYYLPDDNTSQPLRFVRYGRILAGQYVLQGDTLTAIYFNNAPHDDGYYTPDGRSFQKTFLKSPLNYRRISSYFSYARRHPILKKVRAHTGIDYAAPTGTPVSASADGTVIKMGYQKRGIGRYIKIRHKNPRYITLYGHLSRYARGVKVGKKVKQREVIGYVGATGLATGPHLHYTVYKNGRPINPLKIKNTSGDPISEQNRDKFARISAAMLQTLRDMDRIPPPLFLNTALSIRYNRYTDLNP